MIQELIAELTEIMEGAKALKAENENRIINSGSVATNVSSEIDNFIITIGKRGWEDTHFPTKIKGIILYNRAITQEEMYTILDYFA